MAHFVLNLKMSKLGEGWWAVKIYVGEKLQGNLGSEWEEIFEKFYKGVWFFWYFHIFDNIN